MALEPLFRALVVDDDPAWRDMTTRTLRRFGLQVDTVEDGAQAVTAFGECEYDLVILDCAMPVMTGPAAATAMRALEGSGRHCFIVGCSADDQLDVRQRCEAAGMDIFLAKPLNMLDLQSIFARVAKARQVTARAE